jgi:hypothetical protein
MNIIYRVSAFKQWNPSPIYSDDKWKLVEFCHNSFLKAKTDEPVTYMLDRCSQWTDYFSKFGKVINFEGDGGYDVIGSIKRMFAVAREFDGKVLMLEDDYLWRPDTIRHLWKGLDNYALVSPYDHPAHYTEQRYYDFKFKLQLIDNLVWRNAPANTHTFGTTGEYIRKHWELFRAGLYDTPFYESLPHQIWNPIPALATHMVVGLLAPIINWKEMYGVDK